MNGQQRVLEIYSRLVDGQRLVKKDLMDEYNVKESTIQRAIASIDKIIHKQAEEKYYNYSNDQVDFLEGELVEEFIDRHGIQKKRGVYWLPDTLYQNHGISEISDTELVAISHILLDSRGFTNKEMANIYKKLVNMADDKKMLKKLTQSDSQDYVGVPHHALMDKVALVNQAIMERRKLSFQYTKFGQTKQYDLTPHAVYFSDLFFYMMTANEKAQDDGKLEHLSKFRIDNMDQIELTNQKENVLNKHFRGGALRKQTFYPFLGEEISMDVEFYYDPAYVLDRFPSSRIVDEWEQDGQKVYKIRMQVNDGYGVKMWLLGQGDLIKVLNRKNISEYLVKSMQKTLGYYGAHE
jgi:predicted DNA-binding transcriptional regulator YafY